MAFYVEFSGKDSLRRWSLEKRPEGHEGVSHEDTGVIAVHAEGKRLRQKQV